ncbi:MAG: bifunctional diaminohydroxyphosphoribosylaminopyrimidine deaminase/5-amino-6-(5-phosphoribosylamino)uracil reductase RibD [Sphingomonadaceae bacterium]|nr:bifunctional diaminohydroxyphosphoribosylaminopyrimidine deaminase/5-amino-6-(5-phosphoribosylamino)uracil reductase RibD [Sphingomonadaceae bacterium]MDW8415497.1 bifunctional diaminohydroxyphosphoribosylaminopyrimidine deaminase/5-amino-6-(5-phosphoribosylamino)uracil reductase RibD [Thermaurantiacus sp.]
MAAALTLARRSAGTSTPNPNVGCILVRDGQVVGRGRTGEGGRPHAEAAALAAAGPAARGATAWVTLEPCAHVSPRGPACADLLVEAGVARVVVAMPDPDPRTAGRGIARLREGGVDVVEDVGRPAAEDELLGFRRHVEDGRPEIALKLALSLDGRLAMADGRSRWLTGPVARAFGHALRARADAVVVGHGTFRVDRPELTVRLPGWTGRQPARVVVGRPAAVPTGWLAVPDLPGLLALARSRAWLRLLVEGGGRLAGALLAADLVDRLWLFRAPLLVGEGPSLEGFEATDLAAARARWTLASRRVLGGDVLEELVRAR